MPLTSKSQPKVKPSNRAFTPMVEHILQSIEDMHLRVGDRLPSEPQLAKQYDISVTTLRKGIDLLVDQGVIERIHGSGMYVKSVPTTRRAPVRRDTIALLYESAISGYHPYFSEMRKGVAAGLSQLGWKLWQQEPIVAKGDRLVHRAIRPDDLRAFFREHRELGGAVLMLGLAHVMRQWPADEHLPFVVPGNVGSKDMVERYPFVSYDLELEKELALRTLIRQGATNVLVVSREHPEQLAHLWDTALLAEHEPNSNDTKKICYHANTAPVRNEFSCWITSAYENTLRALQEHPEIDAVMAGSDFEAQGALDALSAHGIEIPGRVRFVAIINKESQIRTSYVFPAIVMDGFRHGQEVARLLNERILMPESAPLFVWLRGDLREYAPPPAITAEARDLLQLEE